MNKNIKKYSGLSMIMGTVLVLAGCGQVKPIEKEDYLSNSVEVESDMDVILTTSTKVTPVVTTTVKSGESYVKDNLGNVVISDENDNITDYVISGESYTKDDLGNVIATSENQSIQTISSESYVKGSSGNVVINDDKPFAYAGSGYKEYMESQQNDLCDISYCTCEKDMSGKYIYSKYNDTYTIAPNDALDELCEEFNITIDEFYDINKKINSYSPGIVVKHPVMDELYVASKGESIDSISIETGVDKEVIMNNNNLSSDILDHDAYLLLHKFNGYETSYVTNKGVVNIINNNRIYGNKVINASGFSGATRYFMALNESVYSYGVNDVTCYTFNDDNSYTCQTICTNVRDIISVDGMPVAILRNSNDIEALAASIGVEVEPMDYIQWGSNVSEDYSVCTSGSENYVVINGAEINNLDVDNSFVKTK